MDSAAEPPTEHAPADEPAGSREQLPRVELPMSWFMVGARIVSVAGFVAIGAGVALVGGTAAIVVGLLVAVPFAVLLVLQLRLLVRRPVVLVIDTEGFEDRSSFGSAGRVAWSEVHGLAGYATRDGHYALVVLLREDWVVLDRLTGLRRTWARMNAGLTGSPVSINLMSVPMSGKRLVELVDRYRAAA